MTAPAAKTRPADLTEASAPQLRPRSVRLAAQASAVGAAWTAQEAAAGADAPDASEVHRLRSRLESAFAPAARSSAEALMMKLAILAATGLFLRVALVHGGGLLTQLMR